MLDLQLSLRATPKLLVLCFFLVLGNFFIAEAKVRHYKWDVKYEYKSPDCFKKVVITINGRTPGPTIQAQEGDTIIVEVNNSLLTENLAIHWHGIRQVRISFIFPIISYEPQKLFRKLSKINFEFRINCK